MLWSLLVNIGFNIEPLSDLMLEEPFLTEVFLNRESERKWERSTEDRSEKKKNTGKSRMTWMTLEQLNDVPEDMVRGK